MILINSDEELEVHNVGVPLQTNLPTQKELYLKMIETNNVGKPTVRKDQEMEYLDSLVDNASLLVDVPEDGHCLFSCLFHMYHDEIDNFCGRLMATTPLKITEKNYMFIWFIQCAN